MVRPSARGNGRVVRAGSGPVIDDFDALATTPAAEDALARLRKLAGGANGGMERHCLRTRQIAARIASDRDWPIDQEVLAREMLTSHCWTPGRIELCATAIDRHHELRRQLSSGAEVEALRLADRVDVSKGLFSAGLDRYWLRALNREIPRTGLTKELARLIGRLIRKRPGSLLGIFRRPA